MIIRLDYVNCSVWTKIKQFGCTNFGQSKLGQSKLKQIKFGHSNTPPKDWIEKICFREGRTFKPNKNDKYCESDLKG
jgi:hypothetical protein